ncbi:MAG: FHA domain-containing protein [Planctomycetaceae bacterium]
MIAQLIPVDGGKPIQIARDLTLVGRKRGLCDVIVDHTSVSKIHCVLAKTDGLLFLRDLGSTNGTRVNGQRVTRGALLPGDEVSIASVKYRVYLGPGDSVVSPHLRTEVLEIPASLRSRSVGGTLPEEGVELVGVDSRTIESDSDVRLLPADSLDEF